MNTLTRNLEVPAKLYDTSHEPCCRRLSRAWVCGPIRSFAIWRVISGVSILDPTLARRPLISTRGGLPGEKKRSLIFGELRSIRASNAGVETVPVVGAGATPVAFVLGATA